MKLKDEAQVCQCCGKQCAIKEREESERSNLTTQAKKWLPDILKLIVLLRDLG